MSGFRVLALTMSASLTAACERGPEDIEIVAREYRFEPAQVTRPANRPWTLVLVNRGHEPHELSSLLLSDPRVRILEAGSQAGPTLRVEPGGRVRITLEGPAGTYPFQCRIRGHRAMKGLIVLE